MLIAVYRVSSDRLWNRSKTVYSLLVKCIYNKMCLQIILWVFKPIRKLSDDYAYKHDL